MANMKSLDPFQQLDDMMGGLVFRPVRVGQAPRIESIKVDASEDDLSYRITADIPGARKEDIKVSVDGAEVTILAESRSEKEDKQGERVIHRERTYGAMSRTLTLPQTVDDTRAQAKYENGVLTLTLPKRSAPTSRKITVM